MKNIIFIAAPAAGKGTFSDMLQDKYNYVHISTGDLLRKAKNEDNELGQVITDLMNSGSLVPDDIVLKLLKNYIEELGNDKNIILDGVPRNITQVEPVLEMINGLDYVTIFLDIDFDKAMNRTLGRISCPKCKRVYNKSNDNLKPKVDGICDICGEQLISRSDDNPETFKVRYDTYLKETEPIVNYFKNINKLSTIKISGDLDKDFEEIERIIK